MTPRNSTRTACIHDVSKLNRNDGDMHVEAWNVIRNSFKSGIPVAFHYRVGSTLVMNILKKVNLSSSINLQNYLQNLSFSYNLHISKALRYGPCVTRRSPSFTWHPHTNHTCLLQPQGVTALWLVLIAPTHEGMARLRWPEWLVA